jgi:catechol-2,3-dioxygenase
MAWMMESLDDLKEAYARLKALDVKIDAVVDHGLSLGIYFRDPDGNGVEVSYELSASALEPTEAELAVGHERAHVELGG